MELNKLYYVNVGKGGTFRPSGKESFNTTAADLDAVFKHLRDNNSRKLVVYFHGGLVGANNGMDTAERVSRYVLRDTNAHPLTFVWETGLVETILQNFDTIHKSKFFKKLLVKVIKVAGRKLGIDVADLLGTAKGVSSLSEAEIEAELSREAPFEHYAVVEGKKSAGVSILEAGDNPVSEEALREEVLADMEQEIYDDEVLIQLAREEKPEEEARLMEAAPPPGAAEGAASKGIISAASLIISAAKITVRVIKRFIKKRDHDFYPTIVEEILREYYIADVGEWIWSAMKDKARDMWKEDDFSGDPENWHAGAYLLKKIEEYNSQAGTEPLVIDLVGHSAGSIAISEMLDAIRLRHPSLTIRNVYFMAPAVRCDLFISKGLNSRDLFRKLYCYTMSDEYEKKDHLVPVVYPRSLLYFISGLLENLKDDYYDALILGLERHIRFRSPYDTDAMRPLFDFLSVEKTMTYSVTADPGEDGFRSGSVKHGAFDNEGEPTLTSIMYHINMN